VTPWPEAGITSRLQRPRKVRAAEPERYAPNYIMTDPKKLTIEQIGAEVRRAEVLPFYEAVSELWVCLVKFANVLPTAGEEHEQVCALLRKFDRETARNLMANGAVDRLLDLDPPLETVLAHPRERLQLQQAARELERIRMRRASDAKGALMAVLEILQRVRDKKMHGFKTPKGPRDQEILEPASSLLLELCRAASEHLATADIAQPL